MSVKRSLESEEIAANEINGKVLEQGEEGEVNEQGIEAMALGNAEGEPDAEDEEREGGEEELLGERKGRGEVGGELREEVVDEEERVSAREDLAEEGQVAWDEDEDEDEGDEREKEDREISVLKAEGGCECYSGMRWVRKAQLEWQ